MNNSNKKFPFYIELLLNGVFLLLYTIYKSDKIDRTLPELILIENALNIFKYLAPIVILFVILLNYLSFKDVERYIRKHIFSLIVVVPMFITYGDLKFCFWLCAVHLLSSFLSLYESPLFEKESKYSGPKITIYERFRLSPGQIVIASFAVLIMIGTALLSLPIAWAEGKEVKLIDAFFTATSATCVTGLATLGISEHFSFIGQCIILLLIQIGGLGYMTLYSSMSIILGRSLAVKDQVLMQDLLDINSFEDLLLMINNIIRYTLIIESAGAIILTIGFNMKGYEFSDAIYYGVFHSISAFCNAGFSLFPNSLEAFAFDPIINLTISLLIILGGLGFIVLKEGEAILKKKRKLIDLSVHSKVVLWANLILISSLTIYIFFSEYLHAFAKYDLWEQVQLSFFHSVTTRTAGFNTLPLNIFHSHTIYLFALIMFIGASPGSTGGGIKTTTFAILFQSVKATLKGKDRVEFFDRTVPNIIVVRAISIIVISLMLVSFFILLMMRIEPEHDFLSIFFEVISAFATVGLSLGITPYLSAGGKIVLSLLMLIGRVGPLTMALAIGKSKESEGNVDYPEGRIMIG